MAPAAGRGRAKRVTDPLDEKVKACLRGDDYCLAGYASSSSCGGGSSDHEGFELSGFVDGFFFSDEEDDAGSAAAAEAAEAEDDEAGSAASDGEGNRSLPPVPGVAMVRDLLRPWAGFVRFRRDLAADVTRAVERLAALRQNRPVFRRAVMSSLRELGYNAGICKAKWESRGSVTAGSYEYIDVMRPLPDTPATPTSPQQHQQRYLVDVEFAAEFEIARPTPEYGRVAAELPWVYVGTPEELRRLLRLLADAAKRSLRAREMNVPPWRKARYMQAKWLGPYRRTLNALPSGTTTPAAAPQPPPPPPQSFTSGLDVKCRCVGFDTAAQPVIPPATRTR